METSSDSIHFVPISIRPRLPGPQRTPLEASGTADGRQDRSVPARPKEPADPERAMREALMDCYNG
jgi:hypothetical protein